MGFIDILRVAGAVLGLAAVAATFAAAVILWGKQKATESNTAIFVTANTELRAELANQRERHDEKIAALRQELVDERVSCSRQIGELQGQIAALTGPLAEQIVAAAAAAAERVADASRTATAAVLATAATAAEALATAATATVNKENP